VLTVPLAEESQLLPVQHPTTLFWTEVEVDQLESGGETYCWAPMVTVTTVEPSVGWVALHSGLSNT
jgi:hypothetical protein